jgi:flavin-dependent dehydrogenase
MTRPTVTVVDAGSAGATEARLLASHGANVTLLEARLLPRPKVCGGGLTPKAQRLLPAGVLETSERCVAAVQICGGRLSGFCLDEAGAEIAMVDRAAFDLAMAHAAALAGAEIRDGERVTHVTEDEDAVEDAEDTEIEGEDDEDDDDDDDDDEDDDDDDDDDEDDE